MVCIKCIKSMTPMFTAADAKLEGWVCSCGHTEKAILRERRFTKETYYGDKKNKRGHLVQQSS